MGDVELFNVLESDAITLDSTIFEQSGGAITTSFCEILRGNPYPSYVELLVSIHSMLSKRRFKPRLQLSSSQMFDVDRQFSLDGAIPNKNSTIGRTIRHIFAPQMKSNHLLAGILGTGVTDERGYRRKENS